MDWPLASVVVALCLLVFTLALRALSLYATLQTRRLRAEEERWARMNALNKRSTAARRKKAPRRDEDDDEEDEDDEPGDDIDQLFDMMDRSPMVAGVVQGLAQKHGVDLAQVEARNPLELLKAKKVLDNLGKQVLGDGATRGAPTEAYL